MKHFFPSLLLLAFATVVPGSITAQSAEMASSSLPDAPVPQTASGDVQQQSSSSSSQSAPGISSSSQQNPPQTTKPTPAQKGSGQQENQPLSSEEQLKLEEKQRMLGIVPAFNSVESGEAAPLHPRQKFDLWYHSSVDPFTFAVAGIDAGVEQAENEYPEYHQGIVGFAKRYGASYADSVDGNFWGNAVLPSLLHQDPRYFRLGHGSWKRRLWYAAISTVRCKGDDGKWQPNISNVAGNLIGGAISNAYYPASDRGVGLTISRGFTVTAEGAFGSLALEFYPDAIAYLKRKHHPNVGPMVPASPAAVTRPSSNPQP